MYDGDRYLRSLNKKLFVLHSCKQTVVICMTFPEFRSCQMEEILNVLRSCFNEQREMFNKLRGYINENRIRYNKNDQHSQRNFDISNARQAKAI